MQRKNDFNSQKSTVEWNLSTDTSSFDTIAATVYVIDGINVTASVRINENTQRAMINPSFARPFSNDDRRKPKFYAFIYAHNSTQTRNRIVSVGERQPDDKLLKVERKVARVKNNFAESEFEYENMDHYITRITFSFSVSRI